VSQIFVDDSDLGLRPAQLESALAQLILALGRFAVVQHLSRRRLADVDVYATLQVRIIVNTLAQLQQVRSGCDRRALRRRLLSPRVVIGPRHRDEGLAAVGQDQDEVRFSLVPQFSEHIECLALKSVVRAYDGNLSGKVSVVGSVS